MQHLPTFSTSVIQIELKHTEYEILFAALFSDLKIRHAYGIMMQPTIMSPC